MGARVPRDATACRPSTASAWTICRIAIGRRLPGRRRGEASDARDEIALAVVGRPNVGKSSPRQCPARRGAGDRLGDRRHHARLGRRSFRSRRAGGSGSWTRPASGGRARPKGARGAVGRPGPQADRGLRRGAARRRRRARARRARTPSVASLVGRRGQGPRAGRQQVGPRRGARGGHGRGLPDRARRPRSPSPARLRSSWSRRPTGRGHRRRCWRRRPRWPRTGSRRISTGELNRVLGRALRDKAPGRPPAGRSRSSTSRRPAVAPPTFSLVANRPNRCISRKSGASRTCSARPRTSRARRSASSSAPAPDGTPSRRTRRAAASKSSRRKARSG